MKVFDRLQKYISQRRYKWFVCAFILLAVQASLLWLDRHPMFFLGDSETYLATAITGLIPAERSFIYGYFIYIVSFFTRSLASVVAAQAILTIIICLVSVHLLIRYFNVRPWIALAAALFMTFEPLQLLYVRYIMAETLALFLFVFYVWLVLQYTEDARIRWLVIMQILAVMIISVRFAFIPIAWIGALAVPLIAMFRITEMETHPRKKMIAVAMHVFVSVAVLFAFSAAYKHIYGHLLNKPPAYSHESGFFAMGFVIPIIQAEDFKDKKIGEQLLNDLSFSVNDRRKRGEHRWAEGGIVSRLSAFEPDRLKANQIAQETAMRAILHRPFAFLRLGWHTFSDYFNKPYLKSALKTDMGDRPPSSGFLNFINQRYNYRSGDSSAFDLMTITGRHFLRSGHWIQFLLFLPLIWGFIFMIARDAGQRRKILALGFFSLALISVAVFLVERPTPRFLHIPAWLACMATGVGLNRLFMNLSFEMIGKNRIVIFWSVIFLLLAVWVVLKHVIFFNSYGATYFYDELFYKQNAEIYFRGFNIPPIHYPPLYSLLLAPAFFYNNWYDTMLVINGFLSTSLMIPVWLLARRFLDYRLSAIAVVMSLMLPFHFIYPGYILSENLFMTIFAFSVYLALRGADSGRLSAASFGVVLALAYQTRYLALPAVFILFMFWILLPLIIEKTEDRRSSLRNIWLNILIVVYGSFIVYLPWLIYTTSMNVPLTKSMGFGISGFQAPHKNIAMLMLWLSAYVSYLVLSVAPFILPVMVRFFTNMSSIFTIRKMSRETAFGWLVLLLSVCYWLVATNHSFSAGYNQIQPKYLIGRYMMFLTPLYIILGMIAVERLKSHVVSFALAVVCAVTIAVAVLLASWILHYKGIWALPGWFANIEFNSPDAFSYQSPFVLVVAILCIAVMGGFIWIYPRKKINFVLAFSAIIMIWQTAILASTIGRLPVNAHGLHARSLAPVMKEISSGGQKNLPLYYYIPAVKEIEMYHALLFWDVSVEAKKLHSLYHTSEERYPEEPFLLLTENRYPFAELLSYRVRDRAFYLYGMESGTQIPQPDIVQYEPESIRARQPFNLLSDGSSVIWFRTDHATFSTVAVFKGRELKTTVESPLIVTAIVPDDLFAVSGDVEVYLKDRMTGKASSSVMITITE